MLNGYGYALVWHQAEEWIPQGNVQLWLPHLTLVVSCVFKLLVIDPQKKKKRQMKKSKVK